MFFRSQPQLVDHRVTPSGRRWHFVDLEKGFAIARAYLSAMAQNLKRLVLLFYLWLSTRRHHA
jgi:hypothetical protein